MMLRSALATQAERLAMITALTPTNLIYGTAKQGRVKRLIRLFGEHDCLYQEHGDWKWYWVIDYTRHMGDLLFRGSEQFYEQPCDMEYRLRGLGVPPADTVWRLIEAKAFNFEKCRPSSPSEELDEGNDEHV